MNIREISTSRLKEYENNPRNNDLAVEKVKHSITRFGFLVPVVIDVNYEIVCGHTRVRACRELGLSSIPCIIAEDLTEEQINLFRLVDNKTSEYADWDFEKLKKELSLVDLTLEQNQLLLDQFELTAEVFDLEVEQAEIKVPSFNFMHSRNEKPTPPVQTISNEEQSTEEQSEATSNSAEEHIPASEVTPVQAEESVTQQENKEVSSTDEIAQPVSESPEEKAAVAENAPAKPKGGQSFCQFRFGDVNFFISQVELDSLNAKYAEYMDSGEILKGSFAMYLLKGVGAVD